jgi:hypothetical protein
MSSTKKQNALLKKLQNQVKILQKKEAHAREKMRAALIKVNKLQQTFKIKSARNLKENKTKMEALQMVIYAKIAAEVERQLQRKASASSIAKKLKKKFVAERVQSIKKSKNSKKRD